MKSRIYVDTSVVGGCEDDEFKEYSLGLMECLAIGKFTLVLSDLTVQELTGAPEGVRKHLSRVPVEPIEVVRLSAEESHPGSIVHRYSGAWRTLQSHPREA